MRAWRVNSDFSRSLVELPERAPPPGGVSVRMQVAPVLFYLREVIEGRLGYSLPSAPFTPGTNGIGVVEAVGPGGLSFAAGPACHPRPAPCRR